MSDKTYTKTEIKDLISKEIDKKTLSEKEIKNLVKKEINSEIKKAITKEISQYVKDTDLEKKVPLIVSNVLVKFYQTLWRRNSFWKNTLT